MNGINIALRWHYAGQMILPIGPAAAQVQSHLFLHAVNNNERLFPHAPTNKKLAVSPLQWQIRMRTFLQKSRLIFPDQENL